MAEKIYTIKVIPNAKTNQLISQTETNLKIKLTVPPLQGKANSALIAFLSAHFKISKSRISILAGEKARVKIVRIQT